VRFKIPAELVRRGGMSRIAHAQISISYAVKK
jgi:hypothetical protein